MSTATASPEAAPEKHGTADGSPPPMDAITAPVEDDICDPAFFDEASECDTLLARAAVLLPLTNADLLPSVGTDPDGVAALLEVHFAKILDRYQDSPHLLLPHLESLMQPLVALLLRYLPEAAETWAAPQTNATTDAQDPSSPNVAPTLVVASALGQDLSMFDADAAKTPLHLVCRALYSIIKTAGEKCCTSHFPNDVGHYEDVFYTLQRWVADPARQREWEVRYCLLLWLSNLVLVPFALTLLDTHQSETATTTSRPTTTGTAAAEKSDRRSLADAALLMASRFLADTSKCREAAALLVARLLTRPDSERHRQLFFDFAAFILDSSTTTTDSVAHAAVPAGAPWAFLVEGTEAAFSSLLSLPFLLPGVLLAIAKAMKLGRREELVPFASRLHGCVSAVYEQHPNDTLLCKTAVKVGQRLVLAMLPKRQAGWRYHRHIASLSVNLGGAARATGASSLPSPSAEKEEVPLDELLVGSEESLETGISLLLQAIGHKDTVVRWSAAKGVGRVCERLPAPFAREVMEAVLEVFTNAYDDAQWHGGLLTCAELCRRGLIDTLLLPRVMPRVAEGLAYDLSKGTYSVGAHVRDAACYTCWSVARAYDAEDLAPHVRTLSVSLIVTALFDREVNVRRAAAAAFQECVGRLGTFEHGIELVTTVDFFALSTLRHAYTVVAPTIAQYESYREGMLQELVGVKLLHWDKTVREVASVALGRVAVQADPSMVLKEVLPELLRRVEDTAVATRHGAILAIAELIRSLPPSTWTKTHVLGFVQVLTSLEASRGFRLRGGEYIRAACCAMLRAMAASSLPLPETVEVTRVNGRMAKVRAVEVLYSFLKDTWANILEWVQVIAGDTFAEVAQAYFVGLAPAFPGKVLAELYEGCGPEQNPLRRRGFLAAVGGLPASLLRTPWAPMLEGNAETSAVVTANQQTPPAFHALIPLLQQASLLSAADLANPELADAEGRRNAVRALAQVLVRVDPSSCDEMSSARYTSIVRETLLVALQDYSTDKRGDVGSFVRLAVLEGLPSVVRFGLSSFSGEALCMSVVVLQVLRGVVRCLLEKLDRVRVAAGAVLVALLLEKEDTCAEALCGDNGSELTVQSELRAFADYVRSLVAATAPALDWQETEAVLTHVGPFLLTQCPVSLSMAAMEGLVVAAGDLSEHVRRPATAALLDAFHGTDSSVAEITSRRLSACIMETLAVHAHEERMLKPASRVLDMLINGSVFAVEQHAAVLEMLRSELKHFATSIIVLLAMVPLLTNLCRSSDVEVRRGAWMLALTMIASRYPKVRAKVGMDFYSSLLVLTTDGSNREVLSGLENGCQAAMEHLRTAVWDGTDVAQVRAARNRLYGLLSLDPPATVAKTAEESDKTGASRLVREQGGAVAATYRSLVQETGY